MYEGQVVWELNMQLSNATRIHATIQRKETEDAENSVNKISGHLQKHAQQQLNGIECM